MPKFSWDGLEDMMAKKCVSCGSVWTLGVGQCVFCGGDSVDIADATSPLAEMRAPGEPRGGSEPAPALAVAPPARRDDTPLLPLVLGLAALAVCGVLPPVVRMSGQQALALVVCGLLAPLPPLAWIIGLRYESRCRERGVAPDGTAAAGKILGVVATVLLVFEFAAFTILVLVHSAA